MTADNQNDKPWETDTTKLLARLQPILPGSGYGLKPHPPMPYIPGDEVDPDKIKKNNAQKEVKKGSEKQS